jgi:hypothetical protein
MRAARLAWLLVVLSVVCEIADTVITSSYRPLFSEESLAVHGWPLTAFATMGAATMGALIISRYPHHPVGWLLSVVGSFSSVSLLAEGYSVWVLDHDGPGSVVAGKTTGWFSLLLGGPFALTGLAIMFLIAPDGRLLSRRWRYAVALATLGLGCFVVGLLLLPGVSAGDMVIDTNEIGGKAIAALFKYGLWIITAGLVVAVASLVVRMRRAQGVLQQQLRWILASGVFLPATLTWRQVYEGVNGGEQTLQATVPLFVAYFFIPIFTAIAILRYRLYNIELIINRAVIFAVGTAFVAGGYVLVVVGLGHGLGSRTGGFWPSLLATAAVALAFQPLRKRVARLADRAAYGARALPYEALSDFSQRLGETPATQTLLPAVAEAAGQAVSARRATATLYALGVGAESATWPVDARDGGADFEVLVRDGDETLGSIVIGMPAGRSIRDGERRLLRDLADQAALAFRNASLDAESEANEAALSLRAQELAASRRRIIEARDDECRRLESAISRDLFPFLDRMAVSVQGLRVAAESNAPLEGVDHLLVEVTDALESLRTLSHGVFPTQLERAGIGPALAALVARSDPPVYLQLDASVDGRRFGPRAEAAAYFCCIEAVPHCARSGRVVVSVDRSELVVHIHGIVNHGLDLQAVNDRVEALAGSLLVEADGPGVVLALRVPIRQDVPATVSR